MDVRLVTWTDKPIETMMWSFMNMHHPIPNNLNDFINQQLDAVGYEKWSKLKEEFVLLMAHNPHSSVLEFVNTVWYIGGATRAFQQQLTRTRQASYSIQSLRIVDVGKFYDLDNFSYGSSLKTNPEAAETYDKCLELVQEGYQTMIKQGAKVEDARGILPLNIHSPITMAINLRALQHMLEVRLCHLTQGEFQEVAHKMVEEICQNIDPCLGGLFLKPCDKSQRCMMPVNCGKTRYGLSEIYRSMDIEHWLKK